LDKSGKILGKTYFRDPEVNKGFYSKKRDGVADVDPKVKLSFFLPFFRSWSLSYPSQASLPDKS
jgi:hypothetical protein